MKNEKELQPVAVQQHAQAPDLSHVIHWLEGGCDPLAAAKELRVYQRQMGQSEAPALAVQQHTQAAAAGDAQATLSDDAVRNLASASGHLEEHEAEWSFTDVGLIALARALLAASQQPAAAPAAPVIQVQEGPARVSGWNSHTLVERLYNEAPSLSLMVEAGQEIQTLRQLNAARAAITQRASLGAPAPITGADPEWPAGEQEAWKIGRAAGVEEGKRLAHEQACVVTHALMTERDAAIRALAAKPPEAV